MRCPSLCVVLQSLVDMDIGQWREPITVIATEAAQEQSLEELLGRWDGVGQCGTGRDAVLGRWDNVCEVLLCRWDRGGTVWRRGAGKC